MMHCLEEVMIHVVHIRRIKIVYVVKIDLDTIAGITERLCTLGCNKDTIGYFKENDNGQHKIYRRKCARNADGTVALNEEGQVVWLHDTGVDGRATILRKVEIVREYLMKYYGISLDELRKEVQRRTYVTDEKGNFQTDDYGNLVNKLMTVQNGQTLMEQLRQEVYKFKELQPSVK